MHKHKNYSATLINKRIVADHTYEHTFLLSGETMKFQAGQYVWLVLPNMLSPDPRGDRRAFSICSSPNNAEAITIASRVTDSGYKQTLAALELGAKVEIIGPFGFFTMPNEPQKPLVLLAGGIGITPFFSMIRWASEQKLPQQILLLYANSNPSRTAYIKELETLQQQNPFFSFKAVYGKIFWDHIQSFVKNPEKSLWYTSGPRVMVCDVADALLSHGIKEQSLYFDEQSCLIENGKVVRSTEGLNLQSFQQIVDAAINHITITDTDGKILYANKAAEAITGFTFQELQGQTPRVWGGLMERNFYKGLWHRIKEEKKPFEGEILNRKKDGTRYTTFARISPILDKQSHILGFIGTENDITEEKRVRGFLKLQYDISALLITDVSAEQKMREILEKLSDDSEWDFGAIWSLNRERKLICASIWCRGEACISDFRLATERMQFEKNVGFVGDVYKNPRPLWIHDIQQEQAFLRKNEAKSADLHTAVFVPVVFRGEAISVIELYTHMEQKTNPEFIRILMSIADQLGQYLTRKEREAEIEIQTRILTELNRRDEAILSSLGEAVVVTDNDRRLLFMNPAAERLTGWKQEELLGKVWTSEIVLQTEQKTEVPLEKRPLPMVLSGLKNQVRALNYSFVRRDGTSFPVDMIASQLSDANTTLGAVLVFRDIQKEREIDQEKSQFVSLASHQLRTPLTSINWYAELLLSDDLNDKDEQKKFIQEIHKGSRQMAELVNALLNVSRIELGTFAINPEEMNPLRIFHDVLVEIQGDIKGKSIHILERHDDIPSILVDVRLVKIIYENLLTNSVKYSPPGSNIAISHSILKQGSDAGENHIVSEDSLLISIADSGYGIPKKDQNKIFTKMFRADNVREKDTQGTGLGLYIVKSILDYSGGHVWFTSEEQKGTTFYITIPLAGMKKKEGAKFLE
ncbi:MAG TPA: PAS domain S-box protein [Patescibacteria group bacterium]|nr:PAS domain S-box protein [Patescibacteria group bacterium]